MGSSTSQLMLNPLWRKHLSLVQSAEAEVVVESLSFQPKSWVGFQISANEVRADGAPPDMSIARELSIGVVRSLPND